MAKDTTVCQTMDQMDHDQCSASDDNGSVGIHTWNATDTEMDTSPAPDVEWYTRDEDFIYRRLDEYNHTRVVSCLAKDRGNRSRIHVFVAFDKQLY